MLWIGKYRYTFLCYEYTSTGYECTRCSGLSFNTGQNADPGEDAHRAIALRFKLYIICKVLCTSRVRSWLLAAEE